MTGQEYGLVLIFTFSLKNRFKVPVRGTRYFSVPGSEGTAASVRSVVFGNCKHLLIYLFILIVFYVSLERYYGSRVE